MREKFLPDEIVEFSKGVREVYDPEDSAEIENLQGLAKKLNLKWRGSGIECAVVSHPSNEKKVFAIQYHFFDIERAKKDYLQQKVLSTLFPHNFPRFHAAAGDHQGQGDVHQVSGTIRQTIEGVLGGHEGYEPTVRPWNEMTPLDFEQTVPLPSHRGREIEYPFKNIILPLERFGIVRYHDMKKENFILGEDGGEYFVDTLATLPIQDWNVSEIEKYMDEKNLDDGTKETVKNAIVRLQKLDSLL